MMNRSLMGLDGGMQPAHDANTSLIDLDGAMQPNQHEVMNTSVFEGNANNLSVIHPGGIVEAMGQPEAEIVNTSLLDANFEEA